MTRRVYLHNFEEDIIQKLKKKMSVFNPWGTTNIYILVYDVLEFLLELNDERYMLWVENSNSNKNRIYHISFMKREN